MKNEKDELLDQFISYLRFERGYSEKTVESYSTDLYEAKKFWQQNGGFNSWQKVTERDIQIYLQHLADRKLARSSQGRQMSSLHSFYRFLIKRRIIKIDPTQTIVVRRGEKSCRNFSTSLK